MNLDAIAFPAAIVSSWIIFFLAVWGARLSRQETITGIEPKGATYFTLTLCGIGLMLLASEAIYSPFIASIKYDLIGGLIGFGIAYFARRLAIALQRGPRLSQEPRR